MAPRQAYQEIASGNNLFSMLGPAFSALQQRTPIIDQGIEKGQEFLLNFLKGDRNNQINSTINPTVNPVDAGVISINQPGFLQKAYDTGKSAINKINQAGFNIDTSGIGYEKQFNLTPSGSVYGEVFANQPYAGQFNYGGSLNINMPLGRR